jgi:hypothetical protein
VATSPSTEDCPSHSAGNPGGGHFPPDPLYTFDGSLEGKHLHLPFDCLGSPGADIKTDQWELDRQ